MMRVCHIITELNPGGAESMLSTLIAHAQGGRFDSSVIALSGPGPVGDRMNASGISVDCLNWDKKQPDPIRFGRLVRMLHQKRPDLVQTWLYHADLVGGLAARLLRIPVVWNIRHANLDRRGTRAATLWIAKGCAVLSPAVPDAIICCSRAAGESHRRFGYDLRNMTIIPNGFDLQKFRPDPSKRKIIRESLGIAADTRVVGHIGRYHAQKDHLNLIRALGRVYQDCGRQDLVFLLCGRNVDHRNEALHRTIEASGLTAVTRLVGETDDPAAIYAAMDVFVLSSFSEAFPNVVGEAMACRLPCVVTRAGDAADLVGDAGTSVPVRNPEALAAGILSVLARTATERAEMGRRARRRIETQFSIDAIVARYHRLYERVVEPQSA